MPRFHPVLWLGAGLEAALWGAIYFCIGWLVLGWALEDGLLLIEVPVVAALITIPAGLFCLSLRQGCARFR